MGEQELFTLAVAIAVVVIIGRVVANRLDIPDAIVLVVLGILASLIPQVPGSITTMAAWQALENVPGGSNVARASRP